MSQIINVGDIMLNSSIPKTKGKVHLWPRAQLPPLASDFEGDLFFLTTARPSQLWKCERDINGNLQYRFIMNGDGDINTPGNITGNNLYGQDVEKKTSKRVRYSDRFASRGAGTLADPWIDGIVEAFQDILDAGLLGGKVIVPAGVTELTVKASIPGGVSDGTMILEGMGKGFGAWSSRIIPAVGFTDDALLVNDHTFGEIKNLDLYGKDRNDGAVLAVSGIKCSGNDLLIENCCIHSFNHRGIYLQGSKHSVINKNWFEYNNYAGLRMEQDGDSGENKIINNHFTTNRTGIYYQDDALVAGDIIRGNAFDNQTQQGIYIRGSSKYIIDGNFFRMCSNGNNNTYDCIWIQGMTDISTHIKIVNNLFHNNPDARYGIGITSGNTDYVDIRGNTFMDAFATQPLKIITQGANPHGLIKDNIGVNPFGVIANPIDNVNYRLYPDVIAGGATATQASQDYLNCMTRCRIISANSGNGNNNIVIKDAVGGNTISNPGGTCDVWLEVGWAINWGAFTGAPGALVVAYS